MHHHSPSSVEQFAPYCVDVFATSKAMMRVDSTYLLFSLGASSALLGKQHNVSGSLLCCPIVH